MQTVVAGQQAFAGLGKILVEAVSQDGSCMSGNLELMAAELSAESGFQTKTEVVEALGNPV